jgi:hypothetical protein
MAFADPINIDVGGVSQDLYKITSGPSSSVYQTSDGSLSIEVSHIYGKRTKRRFRLKLESIEVDPFNSDRNIPYSTSVDVYVDVPASGIVPAVPINLASDLFAFLAESTNQGLTKFATGQF